MSEHREVGFGREIVVIDAWRDGRIAALDRYAAARFLPAEIGPKAADALLLVGRKRMGLPLRLGAARRRTTPVGGEKPARGCGDPLRPEQEADARVIGEPAADGQVGDHFDPEPAQQRRRTDARTLQDRRAVVDPGRNDDHGCLGGLRGPGGVAPHDTGGAAMFDERAVDQRIAPDREIGPAAGGPQVGRERAEPDLLETIVRHRPKDVGMRVEPVEIGRVADTERGAALGKDAVDRRPGCFAVALDGDRPGITVNRFVAEVTIRLAGNEMRQQARPVPAGVAHGRPVVEIERRRPGGDRRVDHRGAADQLAPR